MTISELSRVTGVSKHTLRYYERAGLLPLVERDATSRHRRYRLEHVHWLAFVRELRNTGMPMREVRQYAALAVHGETSWPARRQMLAAHRERVLAALDTYRRHLEVLDGKLALGCAPERHAKAS